MSEIINVSYENKPCYDIIINNSWDGLAKEVEKLNGKNRKICIVTESNVGPLYAKEVREILEKAASKVIIFQFPAGEKSKNLEVINELYEVLIKEKFDRKDMLAALGGGVTGDMTGFAAATYLRGIDFIQLPTSLIAQADSSIGGKTGVDFKGYKNMIGAFKQPSLVYMNINTLKSLNTREFLSGMGEVVKHGFIKDKAFFNWISDNVENIKSLEEKSLEYMVKCNCEIKREVVENDFTEKGERATLNFGHTIGHAVEKLKDFTLLHGECVAIGMAAALKLSKDSGKITTAEYESCINLIKSFNLPVSVAGINSDDVYEATLHDKKMESGLIKFILLDGIGKSLIDKNIAGEDIKSAIKSIISEEQIE